MKPSFDALRSILPGAPAAWLTALVSIDAKRWGLESSQRWAPFIGQIAYESNQFRHLEEYLSYSPERLQEVWPARFPDKASTAGYARNPEALANKVYGSRMGNTSPGDGWKYRGRGPIQLTGRDNYSAAGLALGIDLLLQPQRVLDPDIGMGVAGWFWKSHGCNELADVGDYKGITKKINAGDTGLDDRLEWISKARSALLTASTGI